MKLLLLTSIGVLTAAAAQAQTSPSMPSPATPNGPTTSPTTNPSSTEAIDAAPSGTPGTMGTTGSMSSSGAMTEKMARDKLGSTYGTVRSMKRNANGEWEAVVRKGNKDERVTVAADGTVRPNAPM